MGSQGVLLGQDKRWRRVAPSSNFSVDWSHPLARGLTVLWLPGLSPTPQIGCEGSPTYGLLYANGQGTKWGTGSDRRRWVAVPVGSPLAAANFAWPATLASAGRYTTGYTNYCSWGLQANRSNNPPYDGIVFVSNDGSAPYMSFGSGTTANALSMNANSNLTGEHVHVGCVSSGNQELYVDGVRVNAGTATLSAPTMTAPTLSIYFYPAVAANYVTGTMAIMAFWNRHLPANEVAEFSADPFCFLRY